MALGDRFFKLKLKLTDLKLRIKSLPVSLFNALRSLNAAQIKSLPAAVIKGFLHTPPDLKDWMLKTNAGFWRYIIFFVLLSFVFYAAGSRYAFVANDAFISFRYVANAVDGWGYTFNPPPFEPISGYSSFLWLSLLRFCWFFGFLPPQSANLLTFAFSMGQVWLCFLFIRRMNIQLRIQARSLYLFFALCLILLSNRTFLAFMTSGTETALFNFLVLWWVYAATSEKNGAPFSLVFSAVLLSLCRTEGLIFVPASVCFLIFFMCQGCSKIRCLTAFLFLAVSGLYYIWLDKTYGSFIPHYFQAFYRAPFPDTGREYILSFVLEYALYFWIIIFLGWASFKFILQRKSGFAELFLLMLTFIAYIGYYLFVMGGDVLEYRPLSFFIPLCTVAGIKMLAENVVGRPVTVVIFVLIYGVISASIPLTHRVMTKDLETRRETAFLYRPVTGKAGPLAFFTKRWDEAQKKLIYQGIGLRHQEHKVLTEELLKTFPSRESGIKIKKENYQLYSWDITGVPGWVLPYVYIIDLSGQNNAIATRSDFKFPDKRLFGHERKVPEGYVPCFGGNSLYVDPFSGKKNLSFLRTVPLYDGKIKGCESFWKTQTDKRIPKARSLRDPAAR